MKSYSCVEVQTLVADHLAGDVGAVVGAELEDHLRLCDVCRHETERMYRCHRALAELASERRVEDLLQRIEQRVRAAASETSVSSLPPATTAGPESCVRVTPSAPFRRLNALRAYLATPSQKVRFAVVAMTLLIACAVGWWMLMTGEVTETATLEEVVGEVYVLGPKQAKMAAQRDQRLLAAQGLMTVGRESMAVVRYRDSARLLVDGDSVVRQFDDQSDPSSHVQRVQFVRGSISVHAENAPYSITVDAPGARVNIRDAEATIAASEGDVLLEVDRGMANITRTADGQTLEVRSGWCASISPVIEPLTAKPVPTRVSPPRRSLHVADNPVVHDLAYSPDGQWLAVACGDGIVRVWATRTWNPQYSFATSQSVIDAVAFSPDSATLASGGREGKVQLWDMAGGKELAGPSPQPSRVCDVDFSPDGRMLAIACHNRKVDKFRALLLWDKATGREQVLSTDRTHSAHAIAFSPDGHTLASAGYDKRIRLWDLVTKEVRLVLDGHTTEINSLAFSGDGKLLASGEAHSRSVRVWKAESGQEEFHLLAPGSLVGDVAFSADGDLLAVATNIQVGIWDTSSGWQRLVFTENSNKYLGSPQTLLFSPDGKTLVVGFRHTFVKMWDIPSLPPLPTTRAL